jgi:hypothetical protein
MILKYSEGGFDLIEYYYLGFINSVIVSGTVDQIEPETHGLLPVDLEVM